MNTVLVFEDFRVASVFADDRRGDTCPRVDFEVDVSCLSQGNLLAGQLCMAGLTVLLRDDLYRVIPYFVCRQFMRDLVRVTVVSSPGRAMDGRDHSTNFQSKDVDKVRRTANPVTFQLLSNYSYFNRFRVLICRGEAVLMVDKGVFRRLHRSNGRPSIAAYPGILLSTKDLIFEVGVFNVPVVRTNFPIRRSAVQVCGVFVRFVRVRVVAHRLVRFNRSERCRVRAITPPPMVVVKYARLVLRRFTNANCLVIIQGGDVGISVYLGAGLVVSRRCVFVALAMEVFPFELVLFLNSLPFVICDPNFEVYAMIFVANRGMYLRISNIMDNVIPGQASFKLIVHLPVDICLICGPPCFLNFKEEFNNGLRKGRRNAYAGGNLFRWFIRRVGGLSVYRFAGILVYLHCVPRNR